MHKKDLRPSRFLRWTLYVSSILIFCIGLFSLVLGVGHEILAATCLSIPLSSFYIKQDRVKLIPSYIVIDIHLFFWVILSITMLTYGKVRFNSPLIMTGFLFVICFLRKRNFSVHKDDASRID